MFFTINVRSIYSILDIGSPWFLKSQEAMDAPLHLVNNCLPLKNKGIVVTASVIKAEKIN